MHGLDTLAHALKDAFLYAEKQPLVRKATDEEIDHVADLVSGHLGGRLPDSERALVAPLLHALANKFKAKLDAGFTS